MALLWALVFSLFAAEHPAEFCRVQCDYMLLDPELAISSSDCERECVADRRMSFCVWTPSSCDGCWITTCTRLDVR